MKNISFEWDDFDIFVRGILDRLKIPHYREDSCRTSTCFEVCIAFPKRIEIIYSPELNKWVIGGQEFSGDRDYIESKIIEHINKSCPNSTNISYLHPRKCLLENLRKAGLNLK